MTSIFKEIIYYPFVNLLTFFIWSTPGHYMAVGIILLTLAVRFILLTPSRRAAQAQRKIAQVQPLLDELKKEYGDDKQGLATAQMDLYKKNDINPFGSCLLTLIQLPILLVLIYVIKGGLAANVAHLYPWLPRPEHINNNFFGIDLTHTDRYILPVLAALSQFFLVKMTTPKPPKPQPGQMPDPTQMMTRYMIYVFPVMTYVVAVKLAAGVSLYWTVTSLFSIVQQYLVNREKYSIKGVDKALTTVDAKHPEHAPRSEKLEKEIAEETTKKGVSITVRRKKSS